jgi:two-component system, chemotaxis family, chemotaxis protein CheY
MSLNVIVVDDSAMMRMVIGRALRMTGLPIDRIDEACDGAQALEAMRARVFDLAMVDINMPKMDGMALLDAVKRDARLVDLAIVVVSTEASETRISALHARGVGFVRKPFDPEKLLDAVVRAIGGAP